MQITQPHDHAITEMLARMDVMQREILQQRREIAALTAGKVHKHAGGTILARRMISGPRRSLGPHMGRMVMGLGLAFVLLLAPSQSGMAHADGNGNTRYGANTLPSGTTGDHNSAFGDGALAINAGGSDNTATGYHSLDSNTSGYANTASGLNALSSNTVGDSNTASGYGSLGSNNTGIGNTASGVNALMSNTTGTENTAFGRYAGQTTTSANANTTGSNNTFIGYNSGPGTPSEINNATAIGANSVVSQSNSIVLGGIGANTQRIGVGTTTPHSAFQIAKGFLQIRPITGSEPAAAQCATADDAGRLVVRTDGNINLYVCNGTSWIGK